MIFLLEVKDVLKIKDDNFSFVLIKKFIDVGQEGSDLSSEKTVDYANRFRNFTFIFFFFLFLKFR
jgi:hypothetical protein